MRILVLMILTGIVSETVFYAYPFTMLMVMITVLSLGADGLLWVFLAGLILDLAKLTTIGTDSIIFLLVTAVMLRFNRRFNFSNFVNVLIFITGIQTLYSYFIYNKFFELQNILFSVIFSFLLLYFLPLVFPFTMGRGKLKV